MKRRVANFKRPRGFCNMHELLKAHSEALLSLDNQLPPLGGIVENHANRVLVKSDHASHVGKRNSPAMYKH